MAVAGFWIFLAAVIVAAEWRRKNIELARLETMRLLIEKNQNWDEAKLKELLNPSPNPSPFLAMKPQQKPGDVYRGLKGTGTVLSPVRVKYRLLRRL